MANRFTDHDNPIGPARLDKPLAFFVGDATHLTITCTLPGCDHSSIMLQSDLREAAPNCVSYRDFIKVLRCKNGHKTWASIRPIPPR